ncbi:MAG: hypothetical protein ACOY93_01110 [Bacillota bacterium]
MTEENRQPADEERRLKEEREEREFDEAVRQLNYKVHRHMGMTAAVLGLIAAGVAFWRLSSVMGISPWEALSGAMPLFGLILVILLLGVIFSLGTSRLAWGIEKLIERAKKRKAGE